MSKTCFIYCRISQDREGRRLGVRRQEEDCRALAEQLGYRIVDVFIENDIGASTRSKKPRPEFDKMISLAPGVDAILSYSSGRLTRRPMESERLIQLYETQGTLIHYVNARDNDLSTARGRSRARDDARRDAEEVEEMSERVKRDVDRRIAEGVPHGGTRAFGWTKAHQLDPVEAPILAELAARALAGESLKSLGRDLYDRNIPQVRWHAPLVMKPWPYQVVRKMLTNPRIAGIRTHEGEEVGKATWPPIVDMPTWQSLKTLFSDSSRHSGGTAGRVHLLTGLARCGECDRPINIRSSSSKERGKRRRYWCPACSLYRVVEPVDLYVTSVVVRMLEDYRDTPAAVDPQALRNVEDLRDRIKAARIDFAQDDTLTPQDLRETLRLLRGRLEAEEAKLIPSRRSHTLAGATGPDAAVAWASLNLDRRRALIDSLVDIRLHRSPPGRKPFAPETVEIAAK
jgi:site-specific DNA recombinase